MNAVVEYRSDLGSAVDMSVSGIYFRTRARATPGEEVGLRITLQQPSGPNLSIVCRGTVMRIEPLDAITGVGVRIEHYDSIKTEL